MTTSIKAVCGCKWILQSDDVITPTEVIRSAQSHAETASHTVLISGIIRVVKQERRVVQVRDNKR